MAQAMFGDENAMIRLDMSEYMEKHTVSRMLGAPPGYIGHEEGGQLTEALRRRPYSVILLDEIEKAHPDVFNTLLQVLEDGRLTDSKGRTVNCRNAILIMTSNVGASALRREKSMGFVTERDSKDEHKRMKSQVLGEIKKVFKPEFLNRLDEIIVFHSLEDQELSAIVELMLAQVAERLAEQEIYVTFGEELKGQLIKEGKDPAYGARPLRRAIQRMVEDELSEKKLSGELEAGVKYFCNWAPKEGEGHGGLTLAAESRRLPEAKLITEGKPAGALLQGETAAGDDAAKSGDASSKEPASEEETSQPAKPRRQRKKPEKEKPKTPAEE